MKKFLVTAFALVLVAGMVLSCGDDEDTTTVPGEARQAAAAASMALRFTEMATMMSAFALEGVGGGAQAVKSNSYSAEPGCPVVTFVGTTTSMEIVVDYGTGCTEDGINKSGEMSILFVQSTSSVQLSITVTNFTEGNETTDGTLTITLQETIVGATLNLVTDITFSNPGESCEIVLDETVVVDFNGTLLNGLDDKTTVNGTDTVSCDDGTLDLDINNVVIDASLCRLNPISGTIDIDAYDSQAGELYTATITFHSTCDGKAEVELEGPDFHFEGTVDL